MILKEGDNISTIDVAAGRYLGKEMLQTKEFHKILDSSKNLTIFIPVGNESQLRKLPSKSSVLKNIEIFENYNIIDCQEIEGSRYRYFKSKVEEMSFKAILEVYHDLSYLSKEDSISAVEKKLWLRLKDQIIHEISHILDSNQEQVESMITLR
jgi:RNA polymerase-interacting CarD/CdnL/TRCF family regulator